MAKGRLFRHRPRHWVVPLVLASTLVALYAGWPESAAVLRYERGRVMAGEGWRLVTGHLVHADVRHLGWNLLGLLVVWGLFARDYSPRQWLLILAVSTAATGLGFLLLEPDLEWYLGFSGVLNGCMAAGLVAWLRSARDPLTWIVAGLYAAKLGWEHWIGALPFTAGTISLPVVHSAHTYGALGGLAAGLWLLRGRRPAPASL